MDNMIKRMDAEDLMADIKALLLKYKGFEELDEAGLQEDTAGLKEMHKEFSVSGEIFDMLSEYILGKYAEMEHLMDTADAYFTKIDTELADCAAEAVLGNGISEEEVAEKESEFRPMAKAVDGTVTIYERPEYERMFSAIVSMINSELIR